MDRINARHSHPQKKKPRPSPSSPLKRSTAGIALLSFGCGCAVMLMMLSLFSVMMMQIDLPHEVMRIPALLSVCLGAFASAAMASRSFAASHLLCGILCGLIYFVMIEVAAFLYRGTVQFDSVTLVNAGVLLLSGAAGGVLSAMNPNGGRVLRT